jgi:hypothetical protein
VNTFSFVYHSDSIKMCNSSSKAYLRPGVVHDRESIGGLHFLNIEGDVKIQGLKLVLFIVLAIFLFWLLSWCCITLEKYIHRFWVWCCCCRCGRRCLDLDQDLIQESHAAHYKKDSHSDSAVFVKIPHDHTGSILGLVDPHRPFAVDHSP